MALNVWAHRTGGAVDAGFAAYSASTTEDAHFVAHDAIGSIAHVQGLAHAGLLDGTEAQALTKGLQQLAQAFHDGQWSLDPALEDVHMNLEQALTEMLGDTGKKVHTGRSRNDQVATCLTLYSREALLDTAQAMLGISQALATQAGQHAETPWTATTHGQAAQPATLGFLLAGHAWRFQQAAQHIATLAPQIAISPLGSGAVAGSTLPLDPAFTADLMGLQPPVNALLATGTRDQVLATLSAFTTCSVAISGLAEDLFQLVSQGAVAIAPALTTGSSLMPQKRNPDAIELVRGHARTIPSHEQAVLQVCLPLGLGYVRDLQVVKPHLVQAHQTLHTTLQVTAAIVQSIEATGAATGGFGIGATDAAEALVQHGIPFRDAYTIVAQAHKEGNDPVASLQQASIPHDAKVAAIAALDGDATRRDTLGGPAPHAVHAAMIALAEAHDATLQALQPTVLGIQTAQQLLESP